MKQLRSVALLLCAVLLLSGCAAANSAAGGGLGSAVSKTEEFSVDSAPAAYVAADENAMYDAAMAPAEAPAPQETGADAQADYARKIIYTAYLEMRVDDPAAAVASAEKKAAALGGYIANSYSTTDEFGVDYAAMTVKVPADQLDAFVTALAAIAEPESYRLSSEDVSLSYYDIEARLKSAKAEETQLLAILESCETVEDVLRVRDQLAIVRENIESYQARINLWDHQVAFATVELTVRRTEQTAVAGEKPLLQLWSGSDVWSSIQRGFVNGGRFLLNALGGIGIAIAYAFIPAAVLGGIAFGVVKLIKALRRKRREKRTGKPAEK